MKRIVLFISFAVAFCFFATTSQAQAQATRTWVSGLGDDANPCSRTAPCKTFPGAFSRTADCGEIDALDPGGFGTITITKGITIDGGGGEAGQVASILANGVAAVIVNSASTCRVILRNLDIQGGSNISPGTIGVSILAAASVSIENTSIMNFSQAGIADDNTTSNHVNLVVRDSNVEAVGTNGISCSNAVGSPINRVDVIKTRVHKAAQIGVLIGANCSLNLIYSEVLQTGGGGVLGNAATSKGTLSFSTVSQNQSYGVQATNSAVIQMSNSTVTYNNGTGLLAQLGGQINTWNNNYVAGNSPDGARSNLITPM